MNMKRQIITILLALVWVVGQAQTVNWRIEGTVENAAPTDTLIVIDAERHKKIAELHVKDGNIVPATGTLEAETVCWIAKIGRHGWISWFLLENGTINIDVDLKVGFLRHVNGTPMNDELAGILALQFRKYEDGEYHKELLRAVTGIVTRNPNHIVSPFLITKCKMMFTPTETLNLIHQLTPELQENAKMQRLAEEMTLAQDTEEGKIFKELTGVSPDGTPVALSDFVGKGSYVLADFWASWCGPCKAEMPHTIALYEKYSEKGLKVIGITMRDAPEKSEAARKQLGIPFPQIYGSKPMTTYGVLAIPYTILFAPDGTILFRGPLPTAEKKLAKIFGDDNAEK